MPLYVDTEHTLRGWWLGSRDVFSSSSSGRIFSDYLAKELSAREVNIYSRIDQRYFLLDKEDEIKKAYPGLSDEEVDLYIKRANPIDFGKVLQTDYVVSGRIVRCETIHNRAFHWWRTKAEISIELYDVSKNMKISSIEIKQSNLFYSSSRMLQLLARKSSEQIMRNIK